MTLRLIEFMFIRREQSFRRKFGVVFTVGCYLMQAQSFPILIMLEEEIVAVQERESTWIAIDAVQILAVFAVHTVKTGVEQREDAGRAFFPLVVHTGIIQIILICVQIADAVVMKLLNTGAICSVHAVKAVIIFVIAFLVQLKFKLHPIFLILISALLGILFFGFVPDIRF